MSTDIPTELYDVIPFIAGTTQPLSGQRLAKVWYKSSKNTGKKDNKAVSVPVINDADIETNIKSFWPQIRNLVEGAQDAIIRDLIEEGTSSISDSQISMQEIISSLSGTGEGRLTKERIGNWFDEVLFDKLLTLVADKLSISESATEQEADKVSKIIAEFRDKISALSGGATNYPVKIAEKLKTVIELAPAEDGIRNRFIARLDKMITSATNDSLIDLI